MKLTEWTALFSICFRRTENKRNNSESRCWSFLRMRQLQLKATRAASISSKSRLLMLLDMFSCQSLSLRVLLLSTKVPVVPLTVFRLLPIFSRVIETKASTASVIQVSAGTSFTCSPPVSDSDLAAAYRHIFFQPCKPFDISSVPPAGLLQQSIKTILQLQHSLIKDNG